MCDKKGQKMGTDAPSSKWNRYVTSVYLALEQCSNDIKGPGF